MAFFFVESAGTLHHLHLLRNNQILMSRNFNRSENKEIKICYWNIHGRKSKLIQDKLLDPEFVAIALTELHTEEKDLFIQDTNS